MGQIFVGSASRALPDLDAGDKWTFTVMMNIRTYALYGRNRKFKIALWTYSLTLLAVGAVSAEARRPRAFDLP